MPNTTFDTREVLRRLANYVECQLPELFSDLLAEKRHREAKSIAYSGCDFVEYLRDAATEIGEGGDA